LLLTPLEMSCGEARSKIKDSYTFSHGVNAPCESLLTGFTIKKFSFCDKKIRAGFLRFQLFYFNDRDKQIGVKKKQPN